jgi:hypothetical protein
LAKQKNLQKQLDKAREHHRKLDGIVTDLEVELRLKSRIDPALEAKIKGYKRRKLQKKDEIVRLEKLIAAQSAAAAVAAPRSTELLPMAAE